MIENRERRALRWTAIATIALGALATSFWLAQVEVSARRPQLALAALGVGGLTLANLALRWMRWHALMRRLDIRLATRDSATVYLGALPAILTPFTIGELARTWFLRRRYGVRLGDVASVWLVERASDAWVLGLFAALAGGSASFAIGLGALWLCICFGTRAYTRASGRPVFPSMGALALALPATLLAWGFVGAALALSAQLLGTALDLPSALRIFSDATLRGSLVGVPVGTAITGSTIIRSLAAIGATPDNAVATGALLRWGTAWLAIAIGIVVLWTQRAQLRALVRSAPRNEATGEPHFDALAPDYAHEIPEHVRERLVSRKTGLMQSALAARGRSGPLRVLDVGCGQGWYATAMAAAGHHVSAIDPSAGQIAQAQRFQAEQRELREQREHREQHTQRAAPGLGVALRCGPAQRLPYPSGSFDCAYAINVLHHVEPEAARAQVFDEIVRVLAPRGCFFLHEINTANPIFRLYMSYVFPLLRAIDEGTERWLDAQHLPDVAGARWEAAPHYITFLPDFLPPRLLRALAPLEARLEASPLRPWSAHFMAVLVKDADDGAQQGVGA